MAPLIRRRAKRTAAAVPRAPGRALKPFRLGELPWARIAGFVAIAAALGALLYRELDRESLQAYAARLPAGVAFACLLVLPLIGFPASLLHVAAGIRFGAPLGLALVSLSILCQLLASNWLVTRWRDRFERARWLDRLRRRIPRGAHASMSVFTVLLPGAPYSAINYVLPLLGVPLRTFILCAWPLHTLRSTVTVFFGDNVDQLSGARLAVLLAYALTIAGASWWTYRRLKSQFESPRPAADDQRPPA